MTREPVKGKLIMLGRMGEIVGWKFVFEEHIHVKNGDSLIVESHYGFGNVFHMFIEKGETKDETSN